VRLARIEQAPAPPYAEKQALAATTHADGRRGRGSVAQVAICETRAVSGGRPAFVYARVSRAGANFVTPSVREEPRRRAGRRDSFIAERATGRSASRAPGLVKACRLCLCRASDRATDAVLSRFVRSRSQLEVRAGCCFDGCSRLLVAGRAASAAPGGLPLGRGRERVAVVNPQSVEIPHDQHSRPRRATLLLGHEWAVSASSDRIVLRRPARCLLSAEGGSAARLFVNALSRSCAVAIVGVS